MQHVPVLAAPGTNVAAFVDRALATELHGMGLDIVEKRGERHLAVEVTKLWVREENTYKGELRVKVRVLDRSDNEVANIVGTGASSRFGSSLEPENYRETVSDCVVELVQNLVRSGGLLEALAP